MSLMAVAYPTAARQLLRDTLLDAMRELMAEREWGQVSMAEVARAAGVSAARRCTTSSAPAQEFAQAFVLREADRFLGDVEQAVTAHCDDPSPRPDRRARPCSCAPPPTTRSCARSPRAWAPTSCCRC